MADHSRNAVIAWPRRICVQRFGGPRDMLRGAAWCLVGIALIGACARLLFAGFELAAMVLAIPFLLVGLGLAVIAGLCAMGAPFLWLSASLSRFGAGSLHVEHGLVIREGGYETVLALSTITAASLSPADDELELRTRDGDVIRARVSGREDGEALVRAIATSKVHGTWLSSLHHHTPAALWVQLAWLTAFGAGLFTCLAMLPFMAADLALAIGVLAFGAARLVAAGGRRPGVVGSIVLGSDGIALKHGTTERFIAFGTIARVDATDTGARLHLASGEAVVVDILPAPQADLEAAGSLTPALAAQRREALLALLQEGLVPEGADLVRAGALLERRGRTVRAWRAALSELVREASGGYRTAMLPREQALAVLEDGHAPGELRIGAALALCEGGRAGAHAAPRGLDPDTVLRLRIAVETCVNQDVRTALRDAIYGELEEETLDRAMIAGRAVR